MSAKGDIAMNTLPTCYDNAALSKSEPDFTDIIHVKISQPTKKVPKRILHFSDGVLEEYSTDEEDNTTQDIKPSVNPHELTWLPWFSFYLYRSSRVFLGMADLCGERLASMFGITTPKYQYILDEYYRQKAIQARDEEELEAEKACRARVEQEKLEDAREA